MSVYFAQKGDLIKIGWSQSVRSRITSLKARMIGVHPGGRDVEAAVHARFAHLRVAGEWFRPEADLLEYIASEAHGHEPDAEMAQVTILLPHHLLDMCDELAPLVSVPGIKRSRSDVLRHAICVGLEVIEKNLNETSLISKKAKKR
jgi:hypothetical protein